MKRIHSIDIFRALTMFFMIFVNDLWSLSGVPEWLEHTLAEEDGMGFSDVIFPLFLFIVGLSIPLAIKIRRQKGQSSLMIMGHILARTIALLAMGFYMVNSEVIHAEAMGISKSIWQLLMATAIFLIWVDYRRIPNLYKYIPKILQVLGLLILVYLAWTYRGGSSDNL